MADGDGIMTRGSKYPLKVALTLMMARVDGTGGRALGKKERLLVVKSQVVGCPCGAWGTLPFGFGAVIRPAISPLRSRQTDVEY